MKSKSLSQLNQRSSSKSKKLQPDEQLLNQSTSSIFARDKSGNLLPRDDNSQFSKTIKERLSEFGNPLRGPILLIMTTHYLYFFLVLIVATLTQWAPLVRFYMGFSYINWSFFVLQISRIIFSKRPNSVVPIYLSLPMFFFVIAISREVNGIIMILWYISILLVCLQSGNQNLQFHIIIYTILYMLLYLAGIYFIKGFYIQNCTSLLCGEALQEPIEVNQSVVLIFATSMVVAACLMLEKFIRVNGKSSANYLR